MNHKAEQHREGRAAMRQQVQLSLMWERNLKRFLAQGHPYVVAARLASSAEAVYLENRPEA